MHPDQRPPNVAAFRAMLHDNELPSMLLPLLPAQGEWREALAENRILLSVAAFLALAAVVLTFV